MDTLFVNNQIERYGPTGEFLLAIAILLALVLSQFAFHPPILQITLSSEYYF